MSAPSIPTPNSTPTPTVSPTVTPLASIGGIDSYTRVMLHMDATYGLSTFSDTSGKVWSTRNHAQVDTSQSVFGGASGLFDGVDDGIDTPDSPDFYFGSGDFTIDFRFRPADTSATNRVIFNIENTTDPGLLGLLQQGSTLILYASSSQAAGYDIAPARMVATGLSANTWYHFALTRSGATWRIFLNGVLTDSFTNSASLYDSNGVLRIGRDNLGSMPYKGNIDEFRISKGIARWTTDFTPPVGTA